MSQGSVKHTVLRRRRAEFEAFDALPQSTRDLMNFLPLPLPHSAIDVKALLLHTPVEVVNAMLRREARKHLAASQAEMFARARDGQHAPAPRSQRAYACAG